MLPTKYRLDLHTWRLQPGARVTCTVTGVNKGEIPRTMLSQLSVTVTKEDMEVAVVTEEKEGSVLIIHFHPTPPSTGGKEDTEIKTKRRPIINPSRGQSLILN